MAGCDSARIGGKQMIKPLHIEDVEVWSMARFYWMETNGELDGRWILLKEAHYDEKMQMMILRAYEMQGNKKLILIINLYNKMWRLWSSIPSNKEREEAKWEE